MELLLRDRIIIQAVDLTAPIINPIEHLPEQM
jgi:hypothetical protein